MVRDTIDARVEPPTVKMTAVDYIVRALDTAEPPSHSVARSPLPVAGWYVDPIDERRRRWWDGMQWTAHTRAAVPLAPVALTTQITRPRIVDGTAIADDIATADTDEILQHVPAVTATTPASAPATTANPITRTRPRPTRRDREQFHLDRAAISLAFRERWASITEVSTRPTVLNPGPRRGIRIATDGIPWYELPERNRIANASLVVALVSIVLNPGAIVSIVALVLGGVGLTRSSRTYQFAGRTRSFWAIGIATITTLAWGAATALLVMNLAPDGLPMS